MTDNTELNSGSGGDIIATDDILGVKYQKIKTVYGADNSYTDVTTSSPYPVSLDTLPDIRVSSIDTIAVSSTPLLPLKVEDRRVEDTLEKILIELKIHTKFFEMLTGEEITTHDLDREF